MIEAEYTIEYSDYLAANRLYLRHRRGAFLLYYLTSHLVWAVISACFVGWFFGTRKYPEWDSSLVLLCSRVCRNDRGKPDHSLDAAAEVRGQRRYQQNGPGAMPAESVLEQLRERDRRDRTRAESPLQPAADAVIIDSTDLSLDQVVARVEAIVNERLAAGD